MSGREYSLDWLRAVVARHTPIFHLHHTDNFMPCTVEHFMAHSRLMLAAPRGANSSAVVELLPRGFVTSEALLEQQLRYPPPARLVLELDPAGRAGAPKDQIDNVPLYAHVKEILGAPQGPEAGQGQTVVEALEINYLTFYAYNGHYNVGGVRLVKTGAHDGDWEHITARVHPGSGDLQGMWYNAHRSRDGMWVEPGRVPRTPEGRPIAYVALHGHGVYPMAGTIPRHFFLGNDKCSGRGPVWRPHTVVLLPPLHEDPAAMPAAHAGHDGHAEHAAPQQQGSVRLDSAPAATPGDQGEWLAEAARSLGDGGAGEKGQSNEADVEGLAGQLAEVQLDGVSAQQEQQAQQGRSGGPYAAAPDPPSLDQSPAVEHPQTGPPPGRRLHAAHSRGSSLGGSSRGSSASNGGSVANGATPCANGTTQGAAEAAAGGQGPAGGVRVVADDPCHWMFFRGLWGQTDAPIIQPWFSTAEPPLSRTALLRLFAHFWPEKKAL